MWIKSLIAARGGSPALPSLRQSSSSWAASPTLSSRRSIPPTRRGRQLLEPTGQPLSDKVSRQVNSAPIVPAAPAEGVLDQKGATSSNSSVLAATQNSITAPPPPPSPLPSQPHLHPIRCKNPAMSSPISRCCLASLHKMRMMNAACATLSKLFKRPALPRHLYRCAVIAIAATRASPLSLPAPAQRAPPLSQTIAINTTSSRRYLIARHRIAWRKTTLSKVRRSLPPPPKQRTSRLRRPRLHRLPPPRRCLPLKKKRHPPLPSRTTSPCAVPTSNNSPGSFTCNPPTALMGSERQGRWGPEEEGRGQQPRPLTPWTRNRPSGPSHSAAPRATTKCSRTNSPVRPPKPESTVSSLSLPSPPSLPLSPLSRHYPTSALSTLRIGWNVFENALNEARSEVANPKIER